MDPKKRKKPPPHLLKPKKSVKNIDEIKIIRLILENFQS